MMNKPLLLSSLLLLSGCFSGGLGVNTTDMPTHWTAQQIADDQTAKATPLQQWWTHFNDPVLNKLVETALKDSPDRKIAEARILEARGIRKASKSFLFPQIGLSGSAGRKDTGDGLNGAIGNFYDAGFDASFELDVFGKNRNTYTASDKQLNAATASYHDTSLSLIAEVVRSYIDFRAAQNQYRIAEKNLTAQEKTLQLIKDLLRLGAAPRLDVERSSNLVNTTRASLPEYKRQEKNASLRLSVLTGQLPENLSATLQQDAAIPDSDAMPVLDAPASILEARPDVRAAKYNLLASTDLAEAATAEFFPSFSLSGFYGISHSSMISPSTIWDIAIGSAVKLLDFGRIEGNIDAARAREKQAFEQYRKTVLEAVVEVETALNDYAAINEKRISLEKAYQAAEKALELSETLYKEGAISFLDVLDAQRSANNAESAAVSAEAEQAESLTRLFKSLGVY